MPRLSLLLGVCHDGVSVRSSCLAVLTLTTYVIYISGGAGGTQMMMDGWPLFARTHLERKALISPAARDSIWIIT